MPKKRRIEIDPTIEAVERHSISTDNARDTVDKQREIRSSELDREAILVSQKSGRWIVAAERLTENPKDRVPCPSCQTGYLETTAADFPDGSHTDVYMKCSACGSANVLTYMKEKR